MPISHRILGVGVLALLCVGGSSDASRADFQDVPVILGSLDTLVEQLTSEKYLLRASKDDPRPYVDPSAHLVRFHRIAREMLQGSLDNAAQLAEGVGYELVRFRDSHSGAEYLVLREDLQPAKQTRGWGSYVLALSPLADALIEAPHPLCDMNSARIAMQVFRAGAKGLLIAGAHREKVDVPDRVDSVFHQIHVAWVGPRGESSAWQIHGFALNKHPFPGDAQAVLSTGDGQTTEELIALDRRLGQNGLKGYVFNHMKPKSVVNRKVNQGVPGMRFSSLAATQNEQGRHSRRLGGDFVHVELEAAVRQHPEKRREAAEAIVAVMLAPTRKKQFPQASPPRGV